MVERDPNPDISRPPQTDARSRPTTMQEALRQRTDRLPDNHPSSAAFQAERTREQAPRSRTPEQSALARPDTEQPAEADDEPRTGSDGSWEWKGYRLTPDESHAADRALERFRDFEGRDHDGSYTDRGLTPAMRRIEAALDHGHLVDKTEEFALKSPARFKEKLASLISDAPEISPEDHIEAIHDAVRYTFIFDCDDYLTGISSASGELTGGGFQLGVRKNTWGHDEYKAVNTQWRDLESGLKFEVQFHTQASWEAKQQTHEAYEKIKDPRTSPEVREQLRLYQRKVAIQLVAPDGIDTLNDYRRDDW
ncbi:MAG TPA: hypothetical protein VGS19_29595 [Streptosporangiaceae bacterium]|nr:hypothetical protein [Streptosporangiaceae bacterium]